MKVPLWVLAFALPALMSWYTVRLRQLGRRAMAILKRLKVRIADAVRRRLRDFLDKREDGEDEPPLDL